MMPRKRSFFSQESTASGSSSHCSSCDHLPILTESRQCESPPPEGTGNLYAMDFGALSRIVPGRATSMSAVRQRSGNSLSPTKNRPRKSISMFFSSTPVNNNPNHYSQSDSAMDYSYNSHHNHHYSPTNPYGMLNPGSFPQRPSKGWACTTVFLMAFLTLCVLAVSTYEHNAQLNHELLLKEQEIEMHLEHAHSLERRVQAMRSESLHLHNRIEELENPAPTEEELNIQRKVFHLEHYQEQLHRGIAAQSKRLVVEKFGPGPKYYVEMKVSFDPESNVVQEATTEIEDTIWLETASIEEMPHTVHFFLEQVANGVYDQTAFYSNAPRFVQAGPGVDPHKLQLLEQEQPSLAHVLFQEHSSNLNHQQYTLGYPGRPGGPDFYLNFQDNSDQHGLGASINHRSDFMVEADPCFARVIRGFNTLERIHRSNVLEEDGYGYRRLHYRMVHPVLIQSMRVHNAYDSSTTGTTTNP